MVQQAVGEVGQGVEGVVELGDGRCIGVSVAEVVGRDDVVAVGQPGNEVAEHVRARREAVEQDDCRCVRCAGLTVEQPLPVDVGEAMVNRHV